MKHDAVSRRIVRFVAFILYTDEEIRRNEGRGGRVFRLEERRERRRKRKKSEGRVSSTTTIINGINLVALDRFPCWRERGLQ